MKTIAQNEVVTLINSYSGIALSGIQFEDSVLEVWNNYAEDADDEKSLVAMILTPILTAIKNGETYQQARLGEISFDSFYFAFVDLVSDIKEYKSGARSAYLTVYGEKLNSGRLTTPDERTEKRAKAAAKVTAPVTPKVEVESVMMAMRAAGCSEEQVKAVMLSLAA